MHAEAVLSGVMHVQIFLVFEERNSIVYRMHNEEGTCADILSYLLPFKRPWTISLSFLLKEEVVSL